LDSEVGVAGQPNHRGRRDAHTVVELVEIRPNDVAKLDEELLPGRRIGGQRDPLREIARHLDTAIHELGVAGSADSEDEGRGKVREERKGMVWIDDERREGGGDVHIEITAGGPPPGPPPPPPPTPA